MADEKKVVTITVTGPRASGVTQTVQHISKTLGAAGLRTHKGPISYAIKDDSSVETYLV